MMFISCPHCGPRAEQEFRCGGPSHIERPVGEAIDDAVLSDYLFLRDNVLGAHAERWLHAYGCGIWFNLVRDTRTHAVGETYAMGAAPGGAR